MIDTKELRRLAQAATKDPWAVDDVGVGFEIAAGDNVVAQAQSIQHAARKANAAANPAAITELLERLEVAESARRDDYQNWMTALDRNAELIAKLEAAEKERDDVAQQLVQSEQGKRKISEECDALRAMLRAALDVLEDVKGNINPERGYADELEADVERVIAVIPGAKGE